MKPINIRLLCSALAALTNTAPVLAQTATTSSPLSAVQTNTPAIGRLFLSPDRRAALECQRQLNIAETLSTESESDAIAINGIVQRSNGHSTVWINQRAQAENATTSVLKIHTNKKQPAALNVQSDAQTTDQLKVGESINRTTRERNDIVAPGAIRVSKPRP